MSFTKSTFPPLKVRGGTEGGVISLYVHIPFCEVKCGYCDFFSVPRGHEDFDLQREYTDQLIREIEERGPALSGRPITSIFFGGGTPSLLDPRLMEKILDSLRRHFLWGAETEVTMEANPKTVNREKLSAFQSLGINRLSVGVQSFQDKFLKKLGRIHSGDEARRTIHDALEAGFENVGLDLIYALTDQTLKEVEQDLETAISLGTTHLSAYNLTIESGTPFEKMSAAGQLILPKEEEQLAMFDLVRGNTRRNGFVPYEISNFALPGFECRHNLNYWDYGEYAGFGAGAVSYLSRLRRQNIRNLKQYLEGHWELETEAISVKTAMAEYFMMGFRKSKGICFSSFLKKFDLRDHEVYRKTVSDLRSEGWLGGDGDHYWLSEKGVPLANEIMERFL